MFHPQTLVNGILGGTRFSNATMATGKEMARRTLGHSVRAGHRCLPARPHLLVIAAGVCAGTIGAVAGWADVRRRRGTELLVRSTGGRVEPVQAVTEDRTTEDGVCELATTWKRTLSRLAVG